MTGCSVDRSVRGPPPFLDSVVAGVIALGLAAAPLQAQCPDGTPPPCRGLAPRGVSGPPPTSVAVLYFSTHDTSDVYVAEGLTEEVATSLGRVARFHVKSPSAVRRVQRASEGDLRAIGRALNVFWVVEGSVRRSAGQLRVSVRLVNAANETATWSDAFTRPTADLLSIEADVAREVATGIAGTLAPAERSTLAARPTVNPVAYDHYIRGNFYFGRRTQAALARAAQEYEAASFLDPAFSAARARIAMCFGQQLDYDWVPRSGRDSLIARGLALADSVIARDPAVSDAWVARGYLLAFRHPDSFQGVRAALTRAVALDPGSTEAQIRLAVMHYYLGEDSAAEAGYRRALTLDPDRPVTYRLLGQLLYTERRFAEALPPLDSALALDSRHAIAYRLRSRTRLALGDTAGARSDREVLARLDLRADSAHGAFGAAAIFGLPVSIDSAAGRGPDELLALVERAPRTLPFCRRALKNPDFDLVRDHPRFQRVVAECANVREVP